MDVSAERIEAKRMIEPSEKISQLKLSPELMAKLPNVGQADLFRSMQLLPGVSGTNEATSALFVRGGTPDQNLILLDKMPIYYVDHFYGFFSAFNPRAIGDVTFNKGGFGSRWGGRLSSVVDMASSGIDGAPDSCATASLGAGLLSGDAFVKIPLGGNKTGTIMMAGRRATSDLVPTGLFGGIFNRAHGNDTMNTQNSGGYLGPRGWLQPERLIYRPKFFFWDANGLLALRLGSGGRLATTFFSSYDEQNDALDTAWRRLPEVNQNWNPATESQRFDTVWNEASVKNDAPISWGNFCLGEEWSQRWSEVYSTSLSFSYSGFVDEKKQDFLRSDIWHHRYSDTSAPMDSNYSLGLWMHSKNKIGDLSCRFDNSWKLAEHQTLNAGGEYSHKRLAYERDTIPTDTGSTAFHYGFQNPSPSVYSYDTGTSLSLYAEDELTFGGNASLTPGLRYYRFQLKKTSAIDPRVSGWVRPLPHLKLKAAWGIYTQEIHRAEQEDITGGGNFVWLLANGKRPLEKSRNLIVGASWETPHFLFDAEGYLKSMTGLLTITERMRDRREWGYAFDPHELALFEGSGTAKGIDVLAQVKDARFTLFSKNAAFNGWAAYTWSRTENTYAVFNGGAPFPASQDRTHEFKLVGSLEWEAASWSSIDLSAVWLYSTGTPYTAPLGMYSIGLLDSALDRTYIRVSDRNAYRLPDYHRLDLSASWKLRFGAHFESRLTVGVFNAYNRENILQRTYSAKNVSIYYGESGGKIREEDEIYNISGSPSMVFSVIDKTAMSVTANAALEITAKF
jgi:outer membrane receptor for ferrienterochelin and colicin